MEEITAKQLLRIVRKSTRRGFVGGVVAGLVSAYVYQKAQNWMSKTSGD